MKRRDLLKGFGLTSIGAFAVGLHPDGGVKYGRITVESHRSHKAVTGETLHVFLDGVDVTRSCFEADDTDGYVKVLCRDREHHADLQARGALHVGENGSACAMMLRGAVRIASGSAEIV